MEHLTFKKANCKNCYKCLRECPVKAIAVENHQARVRSSDCILCGRCVDVCHQNAKEVHSSIDNVKRMLLSEKVIASVAPSFISSFGLKSFFPLLLALKKLGFHDGEETARGARIVTDKYAEILDNESPKNLIASACPSVVRLISSYYPKALKHLAMVDSPMVVHGKLLKKENPDAKIVFIGPCISKIREGEESPHIDGVITFEDLQEMLHEKEISLSSPLSEKEGLRNTGKYYPINRGIIKSFKTYNPNYEYISIDGVERCQDVLENIDNIEGMFIEMNACEFSCVNGPCSLVKEKGAFIKSTESVRSYVKNTLSNKDENCGTIDTNQVYTKIPLSKLTPTEKEIERILASMNKKTKDDMLDCGSCGYPSCREKAIAIYNGFAEQGMCLPFMRERAESISFDIISTTPNGIISVDDNLKIVEINKSAKRMLGIEDSYVTGRDLVDFLNPTDFVMAQSKNKSMDWKKIHLAKTNTYVEQTIRVVKNQKILYSIMRDITERENFQKNFSEVKQETVEIADKVIKKQMRVVQEIASLLGETAAETKVALVKLKELTTNHSEE